MGNLVRKLGARLRKLRGEASLSEYAKKLGISKSSLARLEMGQQNVSLKTLELLTIRLKCSISDLFDSR